MKDKKTDKKGRRGRRFREAVDGLRTPHAKRPPDLLRAVAYPQGGLRIRNMRVLPKWL